MEKLKMNASFIYYIILRIYPLFLKYKGNNFQQKSQTKLSGGEQYCPKSDRGGINSVDPIMLTTANTKPAISLQVLCLM
ncbi:hypothetical protein [Aquimarina aggregata]|uniref:hypothetical protein n=1 Tax=Aquimarina aggregata TaxID=1642818 RepID=UPI002493CB51|nr:hypothetical protein [Aquimarina aggregata]